MLETPTKLSTSTDWVFFFLFILDLSLTALQNFEKKEFPAFQNPLTASKFFELGDSFDVIIEQTFFVPCIHPKDCVILKKCIPY